MTTRTTLLLGLVPAAASFVLLASRSPTLPKGPVGMAADSICPPGADGDRRRIAGLLANDRLANFRAEVGISNTDTSKIRILTDSTHAHLCQHFINNVTLARAHERTWAFYEANGFYFIATRPAGTALRLRHDSILVFDSTLALRIILAM